MPRTFNWITREGLATEVTSAIGTSTALADKIKATAGIITSGPYTLDPSRAPTGSLVAVPAGTPVLTHTGTRLIGTAGTTPTTTTQTAGATLAFTLSGSGTTTYVTTSRWSGGMRLVPPAGTSVAVHTHTFPASDITEVAVAAQFSLPRPTADGTILSLARTSGFDFNLLVKPGATAGTTQYMWNDAATTGSWNYTSPEFPSTTTIRATINGVIDTVNGGSKTKGAVWAVASDGTETQIGATYEVTSPASLVPATEKYVKLEWGKLTNQAYLDAGFTLEAARVARGAGAYTAPLKAESLYPAAS